MTFLLAIAIILAVTVVPVMIGARMVGARNTGLGSALLAILLLAMLSVATKVFVPNHLAAFVVYALAGAAVLAVTLGTTFWRGLAVSVIIAVIQLIVMIMFVGAMLGVAAAH